MNLLVYLTLIISPALAIMIDATAGVSARNMVYVLGQQRDESFRILVPIWGMVRYLTNIDAIKGYDDHVTLCSTGDESQQFYDELNTIAREHGFRTWYDNPRGIRAAAQRETGGTKRDRIIRNVLLSDVIREKYIITLDADTVPGGPLSVLTGEMVRRNLDAASVRIIPGNAQDSVLARLQQLEYFVAMRIRFVSPWMLSGACHVARTTVWRDVMMRHSLFFQGNDVEAGLIAEARGYRVGHIPFDILTDVPSTFWSWWRQRLAWAGGQVRLFIVNIRFSRKHPFMWLYGAGITYLAIALRWQIIIIPNVRLLAVAAAYIGLVWYLYLGRSASRWWALAMPVYMVLNAFILTPLGLIWYAKMAIEARNWGLIRPSRQAPR